MTYAQHCVANAPDKFPHLPHVTEFPASAEDFESVYAAERFAVSLGLTPGSGQVDAPIALFRNAAYVSKWRNLSREEQAAVDGVIVGDRRRGPVFVCLRVAP